MVGVIAGESQKFEVCRVVFSRDFRPFLRTTWHEIFVPGQEQRAALFVVNDAVFAFPKTLAGKLDLFLNHRPEIEAKAISAVVKCRVGQFEVKQLVEIVKLLSCVR